MENLDQSGIKEIIQQTVEGLIKKMNIDCETEVSEASSEGRENFVCDVKTDDSSYLIGQYGVNLQALQHLARVIVRKKTEVKSDFILDVNFYRKERNESIVLLAKNMAEKAILEKRAITLRPMSPYERRIVHLELSENKKIKTESSGEGEDRQVIIKPIELA